MIVRSFDNVLDVPEDFVIIISLNHQESKSL